jgi:phage terminase large subunit GpA-like protein
MALAPFLSPKQLARSVAEILLPPRRVLPSTAARHLRNEKGTWEAALATPQLEPLDLLSGRRYTGIVYVGPSRGSKTYTLIFGAVTYIVTCAPGDTQITQMSQDMAREMSKKDFDRILKHSPELQARLSPRPRDDNVFDKFFRSGMALTFAWPSASQHSSKTLKYMLMTDYDQAPNRDDVDGKGALWDIAFARIRTLLSRGKCLAESSPSGEYRDPQWKPTSPHEAPPATGILSIYNRGTRARQYWPCLECGEFFQAKPGLENFTRLPSFEELEQEVQKRDIAWLADQFAQVGCPHCGFCHEVHHKPELSQRARWVHAGETIEQDGKTGRITGERRRTQIASYWQAGISASYQRWDQMLMTYLQGVQQYVRTGDESSLKTTTNTDQAMPYLPRSIAKRKSAQHLLNRREEWERRTAPAGVRFVTAAVDVQTNRFAVSVYGWGELLECWVLDYFAISTSTRREDGGRVAALNPSAYVEDWLVLVPEVVERSYRVQGVDNGTLTPLVTLCDSGGRAGVTLNAYAFWRGLRLRGLGKRLMLAKGTGTLNAPRVNLTWPDSRDRKDRKAGAVGDVPVWQLNVNVIKDGIAGDLGRELPGAGYVHFPSWLDPQFFDELTAETRGAKGWVQPKGVANEAGDLHVYNRAACVILNAEQIDWRDPPHWAAPYEKRLTVNPVQAPPAKTRRMRSKGIPK